LTKSHSPSLLEPYTRYLTLTIPTSVSQALASC